MKVTHLFVDLNDCLQVVEEFRVTMNVWDAVLQNLEKSGEQRREIYRPITLSLRMFAVAQNTWIEIFYPFRWTQQPWECDRLYFIIYGFVRNITSNLQISVGLLLA